MCNFHLILPRTCMMCKLYKDEVVYIKQFVTMYSIYLMHCTAYMLSDTKKANICDLSAPYFVKCELPMEHLASFCQLHNIRKSVNKTYLHIFGKVLLWINIVPKVTFYRNNLCTSDSCEVLFKIDYVDVMLASVQ